VNFTANETFGFVPMTVQFTDLSTGSGPLVYQWDFGDGITSNAQNPVHTYTAEGIYNVTLAVENSAGSGTLEKPGYLFAMEPMPPVGGDKAYYLIHSNVDGAEVYFNGDWYEGTIENGTLLVQTCTTCTPVWSYTVKKCGYFPLTQQNTQFPGKDETVDLYANLTAPKEPLIVDFSANVTEATSPPLTVQFTSQHIGIAGSWNWSFGDGSYSDEQDPVHTYTALGTYTVSLNATNSACQLGTMEKEGYIRIVEKPPFSADFSVTPTGGSAPLTVSCTDRSTGNPTSILYEFGDGFKAMGPNPTHTYRLPGTYTITQTISKYDPLTRSYIKSVKIKPDVILVFKAIALPPVARFSASPVTGTAPLTVTFTDESFGNPTYYIYDFGDGFKSMGPDPTHTYRFPGIYTVSQKVLRVDTSIGSIKSDVEVKPDLIVVIAG
jgi:PKD repeat protein